MKVLSLSTVISNCNAHVKTAYGVNVKKHTLLKPHLFISRHLNQVYFTNLPNNINWFVSTDACLFSVYLFRNSYFSFLFLPQGHLAVFQWRSFDTPSEPGNDILLFWRRSTEMLRNIIITGLLPGTSMLLVAVYRWKMGKDDFRCIECNEKAAELHRDYSNGILKITICVRWKFTPFVRRGCYLPDIIQLPTFSCCN